MKTMAVHAHEKGLELLYEIRPEVPERLVGDPSRLRQIIINLVGNAIKFTATGEIAVLVERLAQTDTTVHLQFSVRDSGIGIAPEKQWPTAGDHKHQRAGARSETAPCPDRST